MSLLLIQYNINNLQDNLTQSVISIKKVQKRQLLKHTENVRRKYIRVISWEIYSQHFFFNEIFFFLPSYFKNNRHVFFQCFKSKKNSIVYKNVLYCHYKKNNEICVIIFLKACTLSRISSARVTFYIQNCYQSELLEKKNFSRVPNLKNLYLEIFKYHIEKKCVDYFRRRQKKMFRRKKNFDFKSPMK